jgi:hypothetical protein
LYAQRKGSRINRVKALFQSGKRSFYDTCLLGLDPVAKTFTYWADLLYVCVPQARGGRAAGVVVLQRSTPRVQRDGICESHDAACRHPARARHAQHTKRARCTRGRVPGRYRRRVLRLPAIHACQIQVLSRAPPCFFPQLLPDAL